MESSIESISRTLACQIDKEVFEKRYARVRDILFLVGSGAFLAAAVVMPGLALLIKPFLKDERAHEVWKRFNIPYLKRTLERLQKEKLVRLGEKDGKQVAEITQAGRKKILRYALSETEVIKPKLWDGKWRLISYDIPLGKTRLRKSFRNYLLAWGFYPLHESVFLHAWPCEEQIEFLIEYLGVGENVRIFLVSKVENDKPFKSFFGL